MDRLPVGIATSLTQKQEIGAYQMVNHTYEAQTPVERRYSQIEGESLAVEYRMFLMGMQFTVVTDHKPLVPLYNDPKRPGPMRVDRHRLKLLAYDFDVVHEPGKLNPYTCLLYTSPSPRD